MDDSLIDSLLLGGKSSDERSGEGTRRDSAPSSSSSSSSGTGKTSSPPPSSPADPSTSGAQGPAPPPRTALPFQEERSRTSSSSSSSSWWAYLRPWRRNEELPVSAPRPRNWFRKLKWVPKENGRKGTPLDSVGVEKVIGTFGFSLFGSLSLFPSTLDLIKGFTDTYRSVVLLSFGFIWVLVSVGVLCGLHGRSAFEQAVCRHTGRLGLLGLAVLLMLHVCWTLPGDTCSTILFWVLGVVAVGLHLISWVSSLLLGEDKVEEIGTPDQK